MTLTIEHGRPLSELTTLGLGGPAQCFVEARDRPTLWEALRWARAAKQPVRVLGGGSNLVIADSGVPGLVLQVATRGLEIERKGVHAWVTAQAGEPFQAVVSCALAEDLGGLECLTGIPGLVGATPIQNVGAYGQEVSDTIEAVEVLDRADLSTCWWSGAECGFGYRTSAFKRAPERHVVLAVRYRLTVDGVPRVAYPELARALGGHGGAPSLRQVAETVWALRAQKSMVLPAEDAHGRSAGSFFTNPLVTALEAEALQARAIAQGIVQHRDEVPCYEAADGKKKLAAGWLIERAGVAKGLRRGAVGVSSRHALALVHHGGGSTCDLMALAGEIEQRVRDVFGVMLEIEPVRWG